MSTAYVPGSVAAFLSSSPSTTPSTTPDKKLKAKQSALLALFNKPTQPTVTTPQESPKKKKQKKKKIKGESNGTGSPKGTVPDSEETKSPKGAKKAAKKVNSAVSDKPEASPKKSEKKKRKSSESNTTESVSPAKKKKKEAGGTPKASNVEKTTEKSDKKPTNRVLQRENKKKRKNPEKDARTVFVGNLPTSAGKHTLQKFFKKFGEIESVRFRSAAPSNLKLPKKAIMNLKSFHEERHTMNGYVVFKEKQAAKDALAGNGEVLAGNHIRVDLAKNAKKVDNKRSVFVGNMPFDAEEEELRQHFEDCGKIENVRIVRENKTGLGKGFGYIRFEDKDGVSLALKLHSTLFQKRTLRVLRAEDQTKKKADSGKVDSKAATAGDKTKKTFSRNVPSNVTSKDFQGVKAKSLEKIKKRQKQKKKLKKQKDAGKSMIKSKKFKKNHGSAARGRLAKKERKSNARKV